MNLLAVFFCIMVVGYLMKTKTMKILIDGIKEKNFIIDQKDRLCEKLCMLIEGHCTIGVHEAIKGINR